MEEAILAPTAPSETEPIVRSSLVVLRMLSVMAGLGSDSLHIMYKLETLEVDCVGQRCCKGPTGVDMERFDNFRFLFRSPIFCFSFSFSFSSPSRLQSRFHCEACLLQHDRAHHATGDS